MSRYKSVRPSTQREVSRKRVPESFQRQPENLNSDVTGVEYNRSNKISKKGDKTKDYSIGIQDLDEAIFYYMNEIIQPSVIQNGQRVNVPIIYANPERWKSTQKDGFYRDKSGRIMNPIIAIKRDNIAKDRAAYNKLDANQPNIYKFLNTNYTGTNPYSRFDVLNNRKPDKRFEVVVVPDFVTLTYSCVIQTYYMEQLNKIVESMEYASDSYWGNPERYKFRAFIDSFATTTELTDNQERLVRSSFEVRLRGYIIPSTIQKSISSMGRINEKSKVTVTSETVVDISTLDNS